ncbi:MAG: SGNH/GDSL hydrolase family protein, partial [Oscillospiraceae bacterium]|nr:SGNH/GDSL hydrolase family protein [Oscillospiraceae bacterium]
ISANVESASQVLAEANDIAEIAERELNEVIDAVEEVKGTVAQVQKNTSDISDRLSLGTTVKTGEIQTSARLNIDDGRVNTYNMSEWQIVSVDVSYAYKILVPPQTITGYKGIAWFNADGQWMSKSNVLADGNFVPNGAVTAKFNANNGEDSPVTVYLEGDTYMALKSRVEKLEGVPSENLYDVNSDDTLHGYNIAANGSIGVNPNWVVTNYIAVNNGDKLCIRVPTAISTADGTLIPSPLYFQTYGTDKLATNTRGTVTNGIFTATADGYVRFTFADVYNLSDSPVNYKLIIYKMNDDNDTSRPYVKNGVEMPNLNICKQNLVPTMYNWYGKKWVSIGDSNTSRRQYQKYVIDALGLRWANYAEGGTDASYWADDARLQAIIAENPDVVTIMLGTNNNTSAGTGELPSIEDNITTDYVWDKTTYVGAMMYIVSYIQKALPECLVMLIPPMYGSLTGDGKPHEYYAEGVYERYDKLKEIAHRYGCEFIDGHNLISMYNCQPYFDDENGKPQWTHWNDKLGRKLARRIIVKMLENEPM